MSVSQAQKNRLQSTQMYLKIAEIRDNVIVLKDGSMRAVLSATSINFDLKSELEQQGIIFAYQQFLNGLTFPVQFLIRSRKLNIEPYLDMLKQKVVFQNNALLQRQTYEYVEYVAKLVELADIMRKEFFVIVPYDPYRVKTKNFIDKFFELLSPQDTVERIKARHTEFDGLRQQLQQRVSLVRTSLSSSQVQTKQLTTQQLIELFYESYNPAIVGQEQVFENIEKLNVDMTNGDMDDTSQSS